MTDERLRITSKEKRFFVRRLAYLMNSEIPLLESLVMLNAHASSPPLKCIIDTIAGDIREGRAFSSGLSRFSRIFTRFDASLVRIGESSGTLPRTLEYLARELEKRQALARKVQGSLLYPAVITGAIILVTGFLLLYLFPRIMPVFLSLHVRLPLVTRMVIGLSSFLLHFWIPLCVVIAGACTLFVFAWRRYPTLEISRSRLLLRIPVVRVLVRSYHLSQTTRTLALLLRSDVTLEKALSLVANTTDHTLYRQAYADAADAVTRGGRMSESLMRSRELFPIVVVQMIAVGERSGALATSLEYIAALYESELDELTKTLATLVEPMLMLVMGLVIGFIAVSIIMPIYGITQHLHG